MKFEEVFDALGIKLKELSNVHAECGLKVEENRFEENRYDLYFTLDRRKKDAQEFEPDIRVTVTDGMTAEEFLCELFTAIDEFKVGLVAALNSLGAPNGNTPYPSHHYWEGYAEIRARYEKNVRTCSRLKAAAKKFAACYARALCESAVKGARS